MPFAGEISDRGDGQALRSPVVAVNETACERGRQCSACADTRYMAGAGVTRRCLQPVARVSPAQKCGSPHSEAELSRRYAVCRKHQQPV